MAESTNSLQMTDFLAKFGMWFGMGPGDVSNGVWTNAQNQFIANDCLRGGLDQVVSPPVLPGETTNYEWSWLDPVATVTLQQGQTTVQLPDDFAGIEGDVYPSDSSGDAFDPIKVVNTQFVLAKQAALPAFTGQPQCVAVEPIKGTTATVGQRFQLIVFPAADQTYTLEFQYYFLEQALNGTNPFPPGGAWLAETINVSCKAYGEVHYLNLLGGPMYQMFMANLSSSIASDRKNQPQAGGYNGDRSDEIFNRRRFDPAHLPVTVTYNGGNY